MSEAVELIKSEIAKRADEEAEKIISEAELKAKEIISSAEVKANEVMAASVKPEIEVMKRRILGSAMLEGRKMMLKMKYEVVLKVQDAVEDKLRKIANREESSVDYDEMLFNLIKEASSKLGEDDVVVSANQRDLKYLSKNLKKIERRLSETPGRKVKLTLADRPQNCMGGAIVQNKDGTKTFNNTLDGRLLSMREALRGKILNELLN